jgi:glucosylglycerate synthase
MQMDTVSQPAVEEIERLGGADLVIGILESEHAEAPDAAVNMVREAVDGLSKVQRAVVISNNGAHSPSPTNGDAAGGGISPAVFLCSLPAPNATETPWQSRSREYGNVFALGRKLEARACVVIASQPHVATPQWIRRLVRPILELGFDLAAPRYTRNRMEGLLNRSVLSPLHLALYGEQLENPMGPDFGLSGKLLQRLLGDGSAIRRTNGNDLVASIASTAACGGLQVCESLLGVRTQPATDWMNLSSLLAEVLGPVFLDMERQAASWQRIRGTKPVTRFGSPESPAGDTGAVDVRPMIESFQLGAQNLQDIWGIMLPPTTMLEIIKLSRQPAEHFRMPDDLWVRIVYDFALGHHVRTISRDHLLRSFTPLYVGWIASYALELGAAGPAEIEARTERLSRTYETSKPYLVSRWRWPDRFNP